MKIQLINANQAWLIAEHYAKQFKQCKSITGIVYNLETDNDSVYFTAPSRNDGNPEEITKPLFIEFYNLISDLDEINTNTIKSRIPSGVYKKRSLLMALLNATEIIK